MDTITTKPFYFDDLVKSNILSFIKIFPKHLERTTEFKTGLYEVQLEDWEREEKLEETPTLVSISRITRTQIVYSLFVYRDEDEDGEWVVWDEEEDKYEFRRKKRTSYGGGGRSEYVKTNKKDCITAKDLVRIREPTLKGVFSELDPGRFAETNWDEEFEAMEWQLLVEVVEVPQEEEEWDEQDEW
tara:strand:- start:5938 stop:6495 length:558 start_codon:yes stop_codon:yes gene_type:complete